MRAIARPVARLLANLVLAVGWIAFAGAVGLWVCEKTGWLTVLVRRAIARDAGPLEPDLDLAAAELDWLRLQLRLAGVTLGEHGETMLLREVRLAFGIGEDGGLELERAEIDGGHLRLSTALFDGLEGISSRIAGRRAVTDRASGIPTVLVRSLQVDLDGVPSGRVPIGRVDLLVASSVTGEASLSGHLVPSLALRDVDAGEIYLSGREIAPGEVELRARATKLPISATYLPPDTDAEFLRAWEPSGSLELEAQARFRLDGTGDARASARVALADGSLLVAGRQRIDALRADLELDLTLAEGGNLRALEPWRARGRLGGRIAGSPFTLTGRLGGDQGAREVAQTSLHFARLPLAHELLALLGENPANEVRWNAFDPHGTVELWAALRLPGGPKPDEPVADALEIGIELGSSGAAGITYHGWPNPRTGKVDQGFPLPLEKVVGSLVYAREQGRTALLGLVDLVGDAENDVIEARGTIATQPGVQGSEVDLRFATASLAVDERLRLALVGLSGVIREEDLWNAYQPAGGTVGVDLRLVRQTAMATVATALTIDLNNVALAWQDLPIPIADARGRVRFVSDGVHERGTGVALEGALSTAQDLALALRFQSDPGAPATTGTPTEKDGPASPGRRSGEGSLSEIEVVDLSVARISLTGDAKKLLVARNPVIGRAMAELQPRGFADVSYRRTRDGPAAPMCTTTEVTAREVQILPQPFLMNTNAVRGRVLVDAFEESVPVDGDPGVSPNSRVDTRLMPLVGTWGQDVQVAFFADFSEDRVHVFGAGVDPSNKSLLGALSRAIQEPGDVASVDMTALSARGPIDFAGVIELTDDPEVEAEKSGRLFLRGNALESGNFRLDALRGAIDWKNGVISGARLAARLADTPVDLADLSFTSGAQGYRLETRISAENLPLDREHLRSFVDEDTLEALLGELRWRGRLDIEDGRLALSGPRQGEGRLEFRGKVTPNDMFVRLGLPLSIHSASAEIDELILEGGRVRAAVRIEDLYGRIADRELGPARLLVTYVEPRLSIENLTGELEGGALLPLGGDAERGGTAFSIDLAAPFPFQLALELRDVEVAGLLRGLFPSNIATRGRLSCTLRLVGNTENLLGIEGAGSFQIRETRLWSVPVFRELFSQLGFDDTAVFDRMATNVRIRRGVVEMNDIAVHSPLLQLVGKGTLDFDGSLKHDLDVRYDLVDRLGPFTRLLYSIQNKLLSIAIRGDMSRPVVIVKNPLRSLLGGVGEGERALPLPDYAPLPARF